MRLVGKVEALALVERDVLDLEKLLKKINSGNTARYCEQSLQGRQMYSATKEVDQKVAPKYQSLRATNLIKPLR